MSATSRTTLLELLLQETLDGKTALDVAREVGATTGALEETRDAIIDLLENAKDNAVAGYLVDSQETEEKLEEGACCLCATEHVAHLNSNSNIDS